MKATIIGIVMVLSVSAGTATAKDDLKERDAIAKELDLVLEGVDPCKSAASC